MTLHPIFPYTLLFFAVSGVHGFGQAFLKHSIGFVTPNWLSLGITGLIAFIFVYGWDSFARWWRGIKG